MVRYNAGSITEVNEGMKNYQFPQEKLCHLIGFFCEMFFLFDHFITTNHDMTITGTEIFGGKECAVSDYKVSVDVAGDGSHSPSPLTLYHDVNLIYESF